MFIRKKISHGKESYYMVENNRTRGQVKQKSIAYLGPARETFFGRCDTLEHAIAYWEKAQAQYRKRITQSKASIRYLQSIRRRHRGVIKEIEQYESQIERIEKRLGKLRQLVPTVAPEAIVEDPTPPEPEPIQYVDTTPSSL